MAGTGASVRYVAEDGGAAAAAAAAGGAVTPDPVRRLTAAADAADVDPRRFPLAIHAARMETVGHAARAGRTLGSLAWSPAFARYLRDVQPLSVQARTTSRREWQRNTYLVARLHAAESAGSLPRGAVDAVLALRAYPGPAVRNPASGEGWEWWEWRAAVGAEWRVSERWLAAAERRVEGLVRRVYLPRWERATEQPTTERERDATE